MSLQNEQLNVNEQIQEFTEIVLMRDNVVCDRTWTFSLERFFQFIQEKYPEQYPDFNVIIINDYIDYLEEKKKERATIANFIRAIITYSQYLRKEINKKEIKTIKMEKDDHPYIDEEEDLYKMEAFLFHKIKEDIAKINMLNRSKYKDVPYNRLRASLQNYLMFRLVIETSIAANEIAQLTIDSIQDDGTLQLNNRTIPLKQNTFHIFQKYIDFRKKFDRTIYEQHVLKETFHGKIPFDTMERVEQFLEKSQEEKLNEINATVYEQILIEEKIQELEEKGEVEKIYALENRLDELSEKSDAMKKIMVYERKLTEYTFNEALFVTSHYERLDEKDVIQMMETESLPIYKLQNTIINKWEKEEMDPSIVGKLIGSQYVSKKEKSNADDTEKFKKVIEAGYQFPNREISLI